MDELMIGVVAPEDPSDAVMMREGGIKWIRLGVPFPFQDKVGGEFTEGYRRSRRHMERWRAHGLRIVGVSPGPGVKRWEQDGEGQWEMVWHRRLPEWAGDPRSNRCLAIYRDTCAFLAEDLQGLVEAWQVANELHWHQFAGPMDAGEATEYILAGARGLKSAAPHMIVGHNSGREERDDPFYAPLFERAGDLLDYCGTDRYFGSWHPGGPGDWAPLIEMIHQVTGAPVLVNEWGFASAGGVKTVEDRTEGRITCDCHRWPYTWGPGHTPEGQAEFIREAVDAFIRVKDCMLGQLYFRWADQPTCWQCGESDCPAETAWGLVDLHGQLKPSYHALKEANARLREAARLDS